MIVEPDEVKTKRNSPRVARKCGRTPRWCWWPVVPTGSRKRRRRTCGSKWLLCSWSWESSAVMPVVGLERRRVWIRTWFPRLGIPLKAMIVCWWDLRKRCYEQLSAAGGPKERRRALEKELLGQLWEGKVDAAVDLLRGALEWVRNPQAVEDLIGYLEKRCAYIPDYQQRQRAGLWIASTRVEKFNDWAVSRCCKHPGMSWSPQGVLALACVEAARWVTGPLASGPRTPRARTTRTDAEAFWTSALSKISGMRMTPRDLALLTDRNPRCVAASARLVGLGLGRRGPLPLASLASSIFLRNSSR